MNYAIQKSGGFERLYGQPFVINDTQYPGNIIDIWPEEDLINLGILPIISRPPSPPDGYIVSASELILNDGTLVETHNYVPAPPPEVPTKVHKFWLIKALEAIGEMDDIEDAMDAAWAAGNRSIKREWLAATEIERANQLVNEFATARGLTSTQIDQIFIQAWAYQNANQN